MSLATLRVTGSLAKSTEVMKYMQALVKIPEIQASMQELSREMMKVMFITNLLKPYSINLSFSDFWQLYYILLCYIIFYYVAIYFRYILSGFSGFLAA